MGKKITVNTRKRSFIPGGRITSLFGITMPPKKRRTGVKHLTLTFIVSGIIPSKKNRQRVRNNLWNIKRSMMKSSTIHSTAGFFGIVGDRLKFWMQPDESYTKWLSDIGQQISDQQKHWQQKYADYNLVFPLNDVSVKVYHYWADNMKRDLSNKFESIADMLVAANVIVDDSWQVMDTISSEAENYAGEILDHITTISVTVRIPE